MSSGACALWVFLKDLVSLMVFPMDTFPTLMAMASTMDTSPPVYRMVMATEASGAMEVVEEASEGTVGDLVEMVATEGD